MESHVDPSTLASGAAVARAARESYGKLTAMLAARTGDLHAAEDAVSDALVSAMATWPRDGVPDNPDGWLLVTARRKLIDRLRKPDARAGVDHDRMESVLAACPAESDVADIPDERLKLLFTCAHPAIDVSVRAPLMLQAVLGLPLEAIAGAFIASPAAMKQRLVRAKRKIRDAGIRFAAPEPHERRARLDDVLAAMYAAYTAAWDEHTAGPVGEPRPVLAAEVMQLTELAARLMPDEPEVHGLYSLVRACEARRPTRRTAAGRYVPLSEQDPTQWDAAMAAEAEAALRRAASFGRPGRFQLEAAIQSAHMDRVRTGAANWPVVVGFYELLLAQVPSLGAWLGYAAAVGEFNGPEHGLAILADLDPTLTDEHQPAWALRGHLLARLGRTAEARAAWTRAIGLSKDEAVKLYLLERVREMAGA